MGSYTTSVEVLTPEVKHVIELPKAILLLLLLYLVPQTLGLFLFTSKTTFRSKDEYRYRIDYSTFLAGELNYRQVRVSLN